MRIEFQDGQTYEIDPGHYLLAEKFREVKIVELENLQMYVWDKPLKFPPWISKLCALFDDDYHFEYPEIITLMFVRLALASVSPNAEVRLDWSDILELDEDPTVQERQVRALHGELAYSLVEKVNLYNRVFQNLFRNEEQVREQYIKSECREILSQC